MFNSNLMYDALNVSAITSLLDTMTIATVDYVGLFDGRGIPDWFTLFKTINFYLSGTYNGSLEWDEYTYSVNCRAETDGESRTIAEAAFTLLNRADFTGYHTNCYVLETIPPQDSTDVYNTAVEVTLKSRL